MHTLYVLQQKLREPCWKKKAETKQLVDIKDKITRMRQTRIADSPARRGWQPKHIKNAGKFDVYALV